jgi:hypothetical protein
LPRRSVARWPTIRTRASCGTCGPVGRDDEPPQRCGQQLPRRLPHRRGLTAEAAEALPDLPRVRPNVAVASPCRATAGFFRTSSSRSRRGAPQSARLAQSCSGRCRRPTRTGPTQERSRRDATHDPHRGALVMDNHIARPGRSSHRPNRLLFRIRFTSSAGSPARALLRPSRRPAMWPSPARSREGHVRVGR